jgi:homoserine O-acetyltransferase
MQPSMIEHLAMVASSAATSPWRRAHNTTQRMIIEADESFYSDTPKGGMKGMKAARSMALLSYRNAKAYELTQSEIEIDKMNEFKVDSYQRYQGEKLAKRFNAYSYYTLLNMLDTHNVGRKRGGVEYALKQIQAKTLILGIKSDILFWPEDQNLMRRSIPNSKLVMIESNFGHDGFLLENEKISKELSVFLCERPSTELNSESS